MSTDLRRMSSTKALEVTESSTSESEEEVVLVEFSVLMMKLQVKRVFREVDEIDGKKLSTKKTISYHNRSVRSNH